MPSLVLAPADYYLTVGGDPDPGASYAVRLEPTTTPVVDFELEPNDLATTATPLEAGTVMRGRLSPGDDDYYRVTVAGEPQLWQIDVTGSQIGLLEWVQADGVALARGALSPDGAKTTISDMYLEPGEHRFRIAGSGGEYAMALTPLGPPDPDAEREPNDDEAHAEVMLVGDERSGRLPLASDTDIYRFSLAAAEHVLIRMAPPPDGAAAYTLSNGNTTFISRRAPETGELMSYDAALPPGDYLITLHPGVASSGRYHLSISRLDPFAIEADQEPNDMASLARPFPTSLALEGTGTPEGDEDWYRLPAFTAGESLTLRYAGSLSGVRLSDGAADIPVTDDPEAGELTSEPLSSDAPLFVRLVATGDYQLQLSTAALMAVPPAGELPVSLSLVPESSVVAAYEQVGQRVPATITLANQGGDPLDLMLDAVTSHYGWSLDPRPGRRERASRGQPQDTRHHRRGTGRVGGYPRPRDRPRARCRGSGGDRCGRRDPRIATCRPSARIRAGLSPKDCWAASMSRPSPREGRRQARSTRRGRCSCTMARRASTLGSSPTPARCPSRSPSTSPATTL